MSLYEVKRRASASQRCGDCLEAGRELLAGRPSVAQPEVRVRHFEPVAGTDVRAMSLGESSVKGVCSADRLCPHARKADNTAVRWYPLEQLFACHPFSHDVQPAAHFRADGLEEASASRQHLLRNPLLDHTAADTHLLFGSEKQLLQMRVAR